MSPLSCKPREQTWTVSEIPISALDYKTDAALRGALARHVGDATVIIVAQRISTILNADQILVMEEGRIVGHGTHRELLENCETSRRS